MFIQLTVLGFEPTAYSAWVSSHNNSTSAPAHLNFFFKFLQQLRRDFESRTWAQTI